MKIIDQNRYISDGLYQAPDEEYSISKAHHIVPNTLDNLNCKVLGNKLWARRYNMTQNSHSTLTVAQGIVRILTLRFEFLSLLYNQA
jgi:hypothetical protein